MDEPHPSPEIELWNQAKAHADAMVIALDNTNPFNKNSCEQAQKDCDEAQRNLEKSRPAKEQQCFPIVPYNYCPNCQQQFTGKDLWNGQVLIEFCNTCPVRRTALYIGTQ